MGYIYVTCVIGAAYKNLPTKSDFSQMSPRRSEFDSEHGAFQGDLNLNKFTEIGFIGLIRCSILNVASVRS